MLLRHAAALLFASALASCALNHPAPGVAEGDAGDGPDVTAPPDISLPEVGLDVGTDRAPDVSPDIAPDRALDVTIDLAPDVAPDAIMDVAPDVAPDVVLDVAPDAAPDVVLDVAPDRTPDVAPDVTPDVAPDVAPDITCPMGRELCGNACFDLNADPNHCGRCGSRCTAPETCFSGECGCMAGRRLCGGMCVDLLTTEAHCGACGVVCGAGEMCAGGVCGCATNRLRCDGACVEPSNSEAHCGRCGNACGEGSCSGGVCGCSGGRRWCAGRCVDVAADSNHCGACGNVCASRVCTAGSCGTPPTTCSSGTADCNGNDADMCEVDTNASVSNCGACGRPCMAGQRCANGTCATPRSCRDIERNWPSLPSGQYDIRPDGAAASTRVWCDLDTDGGGWTIVYLWPNSGNLENPSINYDVDSLALRMASSEVLLAYRDAGRRVTVSSWARLTTPPEWVTQSPFRYDRRDVPVMVSIAGAALRGSTLRYGNREFGDDCASNWVDSRLSGRVCLTGTNGPFYNGYATRMYLDRCPNSDRNWDNAYCTDTRRFSIAFR